MRFVICYLPQSLAPSPYLGYNLHYESNPYKSTGLQAKSS
jgi:hypothetical protein